MNKKLGIVAGIILIGAAGYYACGRLGQEETKTPQQLVEQALQAENPEQREMAAAQLAQFPTKGRKATVQLRTVLKKSDSPVVRATAIQGLASEGDYESMNEIIAALNDPNPLVRGRAGAAVEDMLGLRFDMRHDDPTEKRRVKIQLVKDAWEDMRGSRMLEDWRSRREKLRK